MLRWMGLITLAFTAAAVGLYFSNRLRGRIEQLEAAKLWILDAQTEIRYRAPSLSAMLQEMAKRESYKPLWFLPGLAAACGGTEGPGIPMGSALREIFSAPRSVFSADRLERDDREILLFFAEQLGASDREAQLGHCALCAGRLDRQLDAARQAYKEKGRLYSLLGIFAGLGLLLFFL